jgi:two-component system OmpR family response regulator
MEKKMDVLLIEDDIDVAELLKDALQDHQHTVEHVTTARDGLFIAASGNFDIIILDRILPGGVDGIRIIETLRQQNNKTPVIVLSGMGEVEDKVHGLRAGGNDYLVKPFAISELIARIEALTRQRGSAPAETQLQVGNLELDLLSRVVRREGRVVVLQPRELKLLEYMMRHAGQVLTRPMLLEAIWSYHFDPQTNLIEVHISRLRQKIDQPFKNAMLHTIRNVGYILREDCQTNVAAE